MMWNTQEREKSHSIEAEGTASPSQGGQTWHPALQCSCLTARRRSYTPLGQKLPLKAELMKVMPSDINGNHFL